MLKLVEQFYATSLLQDDKATGTEKTCDESEDYEGPLSLQVLHAGVLVSACHPFQYAYALLFSLCRSLCLNF